MVRRSGRSPEVADLERLLAALREARLEVVRAQASLTIGCRQYLALDAFRGCVDDLAEVLSGNREIFWLKPGKIGKSG